MIAYFDVQQMGYTLACCTEALSVRGIALAREEQSNHNNRHNDTCCEGADACTKQTKLWEGTYAIDEQKVAYDIQRIA